MSKKVHLTRRDELKTEQGIQLRTDDPSTLVEGLPWVNFSDSKFRMYLGGQTKEIAFVGQNAGQTLYSTVVTTAADLKSTVESLLVDTVYLREGTYDLTGLAGGVNIQKSLRLIGEKTGGSSASQRVRIITDSSHLINAAPASTTITNAGTVSVTNNSITVNLNTGTWSTDFTGQFFVVNGVAYEIASTPTTTQIILKRRYTGSTSISASYYITPMLNMVSIENIEIVASASTHSPVKFRNIIRPVLVNCVLHTDNSDLFYGSVETQYCFDAIFYQNSFRNFKIDLLNHNYNSLIIDNEFISTIVMGTNQCVTINTSTGTSSIHTNNAVCRNIFSGPAPSIEIDDSNSNNISDNIISDCNNKAIVLNSNSHDNIINGNRIRGIGTTTLIEVNGDFNVVNGNRITQGTGFAINFSATAASNTAIGNRITGGATINDTIAANQNRIEDDFSRFGSAPTGTSKDFIDVINGVFSTLQNTPSGIVQSNASVNSGVIDESVVAWNSSTSEFVTADVNSAFTAAGIVKKITTTTGNVVLGGLIRLSNSGSVQNSQLFNVSNIGKRFYLGVSGILIPETSFLASGVVTAPKVVGTLIDVVGSGAVSQFFVNINEDFKYGTPSNSFSLGVSGTAEKYIVARGVAGNLDQISFNPSSRTWFVVKGTRSGEIVQPYNRADLANSLIDYTSSLITASSGSVIVGPHTVFSQGYKITQSGTVTPYSGFSGNVYIYSHLESGVIKSQAYENAAFIASIYNSGNAFLTSTALAVKQYNSSQDSQSGIITPSTSGSYTLLGSVYFPYNGNVTLRTSASVTGYANLQSLNPYQTARIKLQLNGFDIENSEKQMSLPYISGQTTYVNMSSNAIITASSSSGVVNRIDLLGSYDFGGSTDPVKFTKINLSVAGI